MSGDRPREFSRPLATAVAAVVLALLPGAIEAERADACSCAPISAGELLDQADAAVVGRLVEVLPQGSGSAEFRYRVTRVYKGKRRISEQKSLTVGSGDQESACGLPQQEGRRYGLFLDRTGKGWASGLCSVVGPREMRRAASQKGTEARFCS